jgi:trk system potassium uptake protein TrkA
MRIVILGCGRVGAQLASSFSQDGHDVRVIDRRAEAFGRLPSVFHGQVVVGEGIDEDVLRKAGSADADIFAAVTDDDSTNVMASQVAKSILGVPRVITRIYDPLRDEAYRSFGLETVCPTTLSAELVENLLQQPASGDVRPGVPDRAGS